MNLQQAKQWCKVRGYIYRKSEPEKRYWKYSLLWENMDVNLPKADYEAQDWKTDDPEADENPLTA